MKLQNKSIIIFHVYLKSILDLFGTAKNKLQGILIFQVLPSAWV